MTPALGDRRRQADRLAARPALALGAILAALGLAVAGRPFVPLYDGLISPDAYRWLSPPPGEHASPQGVTAKLPVSGNQSPLLAVATPENVPQAQVFAIPGGLIVPAGTTEIDVAIAAVQPPSVAPPAGQVITGNVYAITVTTSSGAVVTADPASQVSVVLRAPDANQAEATVARFDGSAWQPLSSDPAGVGATFEAVVTQFGEFALLATPPVPTAATGTGGESPATTPSQASGSAPAGTPGGSIGLASELPSVGPGDADQGFDGIDRGVLTLVLGGLAVAIVGLVALAALAPGRRAPPSRGAGRGEGRGDGRGGPPRRRRR